MLYTVLRSLLDYTQVEILFAFQFSREWPLPFYIFHNICMLSLQEKSCGHFYLFIITMEILSLWSQEVIPSGPVGFLLLTFTPHFTFTDAELLSEPLPSKHFFISTPRGFLLVFLPHKWIIMMLYDLLNCLLFN